MKINEVDLDIDEKLAEFDQWLTPKLERIKDTDKFNAEITSISQCITRLSGKLDGFAHERKSIDSLVVAIIETSEEVIKGSSFKEDEAAVSDYYYTVFNLLFLATGATDNNLKNHFLIKLKEDDVKQLMPKRGGTGKKVKFTLTKVPSTTKSDLIARMLASCYVGIRKKYQSIVTTEPQFSLSFYLELFLKEYVSLILEDDDDLSQLWVIGSSFMALAAKSDDMARLLINSCTIFKVRGSVSATGGHIPEDIMRGKLENIGLESGSDYNISDVIVGEEEIIEAGKRKKKTRAYDFVLPYKVQSWEPHLFIQSQFYAGDSGSVSHKVVDQTSSSRVFTRQKFPHARFIEYLDGAGYYASLRGDLKHMLEMESTHSFIQVKSILVRLRRELQAISFLTPIEFEHAILRTENGDIGASISYLSDEGYTLDEIKRVEALLIARKMLKKHSTNYEIDINRTSYAKKLFILDVAVNNSSKVTDEQRLSGNYILVPGCGSNFGIKSSDLARLVVENIKYIDISPVDYESDIEFLMDEKVISRR